MKRAVLLLTVMTIALVVMASPAWADTFTVNKTGDAGDRKLSDAKCDTSRNNGSQCTLRAAIEESNDTAGADTIDFDISGAKTTIKPDSSLPTITDPVTIDGYTQQGASENTLAEGNDAVLKVNLIGSNAGADADGLVIITSDSTIKGLVINRFDDDGIVISGFVATGNNKVEGNFIGTNDEGTGDKGNGGEGVLVVDDSSTIGGTTPDKRNVISGNDQNGVFIFGSPSDGNRIEGNFIGTTADGSGDLGNTQDGVIMQGTNNTVGGVDDTGTPQTEFPANTIAHNGGDGVSVSRSDSAGNNALSNSIFSNGGLGIDLDSDGVTANDTDDPDTGANNLQNFPVLSSAIRSNTTGITTIAGTLNSTPSLDFAVQCFLTDEASDSDHGEGSVLLGTIVTTTDANGDADFFCHSSLPTLGQVPEQTVSATATDILTTGDTSEFSLNVGVSAGL